MTAQKNPPLTDGVRHAIERIAEENGFVFLPVEKFKVLSVQNNSVSVDRVTSPEVAALAAKGLADPASLTPEEIQSVCASAVAQA